MRILLDTHIFLWVVADDPRLTHAGRDVISQADEAFVSSASIWEAAIKIALGKLDADVNRLVDAIEASGFVELPVRVHHAAKVRDLPNLHRDPFDRLLIAQALSEPLHLITADAQLPPYSDLILPI